MPQTRKAGKHTSTGTDKSKGMTIPQLRRAFEHMEQFVKKTDYELTAFRKEWEKTFGKSVSPAAAKDYLAYMKERKTTVQQGGMAPLDYQLRAGVDGVYGNFPPYVSDGFGKGINIDSFNVGCGKENISPTVPATMGSNLVKSGGGKRNRQTKRKQRGGGWISPSMSSAISEFMQRPFGMGSPPSSIQAAQMEAKGVAPLPSGDPVQNPLTHVSRIDGGIFTASTSPSSRVF